MNETLRFILRELNIFLGNSKNSTSKKKSRNSINDVMKNSNYQIVQIKIVPERTNESIKE